MIVAGAAIGGSHIVAATQAGARFGPQLIWFIVLVNVLKLPFFLVYPTIHSSYW